MSPHVCKACNPAAQGLGMDAGPVEVELQDSIRENAAKDAMDIVRGITFVGPVAVAAATFPFSIAVQDATADAIRGIHEQ